MKIHLREITEYQEKQCELFAEYSVNSSLDEYKRRNQIDKVKIISDIQNGKKAEFMVYNFLTEQLRKQNSPDLNIYEGFKKSYEADLILKNANIHVKSHIHNNNFPVSWVFQKNDPLLSNKNDIDFLALVVMDKTSNYMYLKKIKDVEFKEPLKECLKMTKACVYEIDLIE